MIIQGGNYNPTTNMSYRANTGFIGNPNTFPIAFSNRCLFVNAIVNPAKLYEYEGNAIIRPGYAYNINNTSFICGYDYTCSQGRRANTPIAIVAIGI